MAVNIELRIAGIPVGGAEVWWVEVERELDEVATEGYPLLRHIDSYGDVVFPHATLAALREELAEFLAVAPRSVQNIIVRLMELCDEAVRHDDAALHFIGD